jgi:hypothetical protein
VIPRPAALIAVAGLRELYESDEAQALSPSPKAADLLALVDVVMSFTRGGIETSAARTPRGATEQLRS